MATKLHRSFLAGFLLVLWAPSAFALDAAGERYIQQMVNGGPTSIKQAAESMFRTANTDPEVLDVAAEVLLQNYAKSTGSTEMDAMAWVCKALGKSGNGRYKPAIDEVAKSEHRKLQKHCSNAAEDLPDPEGPGYTTGTVNLAKYRQQSAAAAPASAPSAASTSAPTGGARKATLKDIKPGMSMEEVIGLLGPPTATTSHMTGQAFNPFNFKGGGTVNQYGLYKGMGRVVYTKESRFTSTLRVVEVLENPGESGYP